MEVGSYAELFTIVLGWHFYNVIWDVLTATGIVYLPFLGILVEHWKDAFVVGEDGNGAGQAVRAMEMELYLALTVVLLAAVPNPWTPLNKSAVLYTPPATTAEPTPTTVNATSSSSTFDSTLGTYAPATVNVPVWWYSVLALSSGVNAAVISGSNVSLDGLMKLKEAGQLAKIEDPLVREELVRFYGECFVPARSLYMSAKPVNPTIATALTLYGPGDPEWVGSHVFRDDPMFYADMYAEREVVGWAFDPSRDKDLDGGPTLPAWGRPSCKQWWEDGTIGLRQKLWDQANSTSKLASLIPTFGSTLSAEKQTDLVVKVLTDKTALSVNDTSYGSKSSGFLSAIGDAAKGTATSTIGTIMYVFAWATTAVVRPALPFVQAFVLFAIALFLPLLLVMSRYSLNIMVLGAIAIFTVKFWSVMWYIADFFNDQFAKALYPEGYDFIAAISNPKNFFSDFSKDIVLNLVLLGLYVMLPLIWTGLMGMIGLKAADAVSAAKQSAIKSMGSAGSIAGGIARFGLRGAGRLLGRRR